MAHSEIYSQMADSIVNLNLEAAKALAQRALNENMNLLEVIEKGFGEGIQRVGELWEEGEFFLPELMRGAEIMQEAVNLITPKLQEQGSAQKSLGKIVMATIEGDIHTIGKTIVATMLRANGFEIIDLGPDVPAEKIVEEAINNKADLIGVSALLTTTMINQKKVIENLVNKNARHIKVMLGGAPVTAKWVEECKADGYAENAIEAVKVAKSLLNK
ncbi:MAG: B12-binding domain-containing protein [Candidatus Hermodarchaeota archaeon]